MTVDSANATPAIAANGHGVSVSFQDMHRWYGSVHALDGLSIDIEPGELVALLGPSGCGKTTALRALGGLDEIDAGRILVVSGYFFECGLTSGSDELFARSNALLASPL